MDNQNVGCQVLGLYMTEYPPTPVKMVTNTFVSTLWLPGDPVDLVSFLSLPQSIQSANFVKQLLHYLRPLENVRSSLIVDCS